MAWYDGMTPEQAKAWMNSPVRTKFVGKDQHGRDIIALDEVLSLRATHAIAELAKKA